MSQNRIFNFSAGPSMLPLSVLEKAAAEMTNYNGSGMSVMEMSHRSSVYLEVFEKVKSSLRRVMNVPDTHEILFMQGGATFQFAAVAMNLIGRTGSADYADTGNFASLAAKEAAKYGQVNIVASTKGGNYTTLPLQSELMTSPDASYFYYCSNNTIFGTEWQYVPDVPSPLVCDMSSNILSMPVDVSKYGVIFAGVQKNMAPAGMAVVIMDKSLAGSELAITPTIMNYKTMIEKDSMYNTPPCYNIYMLGLVLDWVESMGGLTGMEALKKERSTILYDYIDNSALFNGVADPEVRSGMNVTFTTGNADLDAAFAKKAGAAGFSNLKGHRLTGGLRASIYNAMPVEGVKALVEYMKAFEKENA